MTPTLSQTKGKDGAPLFWVDEREADIDRVRESIGLRDFSHWSVVHDLP
jgi:hypothetical protein